MEEAKVLQEIADDCGVWVEFCAGPAYGGAV